MVQFANGTFSFVRENISGLSSSSHTVHDWLKRVDLKCALPSLVEFSGFRNEMEGAVEDVETRIC